MKVLHSVSDATNTNPVSAARIALVLGGGGLKGFAHIGVLRALEERGIVPSVYAGSSIGALIASASATGMSSAEIEARGRGLRRRNLFRINHVGMLLERMRSPSIYLEHSLRSLVCSIVPHVRFEELSKPLMVNTVDVDRGTQVVWGLPGFRDVYVDDAVYASCALPGFFPPGKVDGRVCVDGGTVDNLPVSIAARDVDAIIAVDVGTSDVPHQPNVADRGFASIYMRALTVMMHSLQGISLEHWNGPPMILIRPRVSKFGWFSFEATSEMIDLGYRAAVDALSDLDACLAATGGIFPKKLMRLSVNPAACTRCGLCVAQAPEFMTFDPDGRVVPRQDEVDWSPTDGEFIRHCPTGAIEIRRVVPVLDASA